MSSHGSSILTDEKKFTVYFYFQVFATFFVMIWDFRVDWGFFGATKGFLLRNPKAMKFKPRFYISCMIFNVIFRFWWIIGIWVF